MSQPFSSRPVRKLDARFMEHVADRVNADPELNLIGGNFDATISFVFGDQRHDVELIGGKVAALRHGEKIDGRSDFGLRAPEAIWDRFFQSPPPPLHNSVFAMIMRVPEFHLDGDSLVLAQNVRAFTRLMSVMQEAAQ